MTVKRSEGASTDSLAARAREVIEQAGGIVRYYVPSYPDHQIDVYYPGVDYEDHLPADVPLLVFLDALDRHPDVFACVMPYIPTCPSISVISTERLNVWFYEEVFRQGIIDSVMAEYGLLLVGEPAFRTKFQIDRSRVAADVKAADVAESIRTERADVVEDARPERSGFGNVLPKPSD